LVTTTITLAENRNAAKISNIDIAPISFLGAGIEQEQQRLTTTGFSKEYEID
jgi:hypothetical protein